VFLNCHGSLLPRHRGPNPYIATILAGETVSGVTFHWMDAGLDTGPIALQQVFEVAPDETGGSLQQKAAWAAVSLLPSLIEGLQRGTLPKQPQEASHASYEGLAEGLGCVRWQDSPEEICKLGRALSPWAFPYTLAWGQRFFLGALRPTSVALQSPFGTVLSVQKDVMIVATGQPGRAIEAKLVETPGAWRLVQYGVRALCLRPGLRFNSPL